MPAEHHSTHPRTLQVIVDPRIELLAVVQFISSYRSRFPLLTRFNLPYKNEIEETFYAFSDHQVVKLFDQMMDTFHADAPPAAMLHLSAPPALIVHAPFTNYLLKRAGGMERLEQFIALLREFAQASRFMDFYQNHSTFYASFVQETSAQLSAVDDVAVLEDYFGKQRHRYTLILAPLFSDAGYGPSICREDGSYDLYCITGPSGVDAQNPTFGELTTIRSLMWHEFSHPFVNPLTELYLDVINQYQGLFQPVAEQMRNYGYNNWEITVNELVVRAVTIRMAARELGDVEGQIRLEQEVAWGFIYTALLVEKLKRYEEQRDRFPAFSDFYHELCKGFAEAKPFLQRK